MSRAASPSETPRPSEDSIYAEVLEVAGTPRPSPRRRDTLPPDTATTENGRQVVVKSTDMTEAMQKEAIQVAVQAIERFKIEKDIAAWIKEEFDRRHLPSWHCVVGRNFGSYVTHETNHFIYFYVQHIAVMLFKTGF